MKKSLESSLRELIALKDGNKELAVFFMPDEVECWSVHVGNPTQSVMLGEVWGECCGKGKTLRAAIARADKAVILWPNVAALSRTD